ncbi:hypothetical protein BT69DRAFT_1282532 [Atractiella rhizophila]|nr:hypothetical protein BT69DRAFT_1282532 [Atractiella rhizophila]
MEERREKDRPGVSSTLRHVLSPQIPSRPTSHPSPLTFTLHFAFHQPPAFSHSGLLGFSFCWQCSPLHLLSHSTCPHASTKPVARKLDSEWRLIVRKRKGRGRSDNGSIVTMGCRRYASHFVAPPFALLAIRLHPMPYRVPMPPSYSLSHPTFNRTPACTSWLFSTDACFMTLRATNEMADGERGGQSIGNCLSKSQPHLAFPLTINHYETKHQYQSVLH